MEYCLTTSHIKDTVDQLFKVWLIQTKPDKMGFRPPTYCACTNTHNTLAQYIIIMKELIYTILT